MSGPVKILTFVITGAAIVCAVFLFGRGAASSAPVYDTDTAMTLAGERVPAGLDSYYFTIIDAGTDEARQTTELTQLFRDAANASDYLGLIGPDGPRLRRVTLNAIEQAAGTDLSAVTLVYVGPPEDRAALVAGTAKAHIMLRYVAYP